MALTTMTSRADTLFGMAADAEFVSFLLVYAKLAGCPFMAIFAGIKAHMF